MAQAQYAGTGRRKNAVARVRLVPGTGKLQSIKYQEYIHTQAFVLLSTNLSQLLQLKVHTMFLLTL